MTKTIAAATGVPEPTVAMVVRELREARMLTTGARGVNAPPMTPTDAARVLIALLVYEKPVDAPRAVLDFGALRCNPPEDLFPEKEPHSRHTFTLGLNHEHSFEEGCAALIRVLGNWPQRPFWNDSKPSNLEPFIAIRADISAVKSEIQLPALKYRYVHAAFNEIRENESPMTLQEVAKTTTQVLARYFKTAQIYRTSKILRQAELREDSIIPISAEFEGC